LIITAKIEQFDANTNAVVTTATCGSVTCLQVVYLKHVKLNYLFSISEHK